MKGLEPFGRRDRVDAIRLQLLLDDPGQLLGIGDGPNVLRVNQEEAEPVLSREQAQELLLGHELALEDAIAQRAHEAQGHGRGRPDVERRVSPTDAWRICCSEVASAITGTVPSVDGRRSSSHGFAFSCSVSASDAENAKRRSSRNDPSGAMIVGLPGR